MSLLTRFDPLGDFDRLGSELLGAVARRAATMPIDAYKRGDQWVVKVDLPGVEASSIDLTVDRNVLRIEATRNWQPQEGDVVLAAERPRGTFSRQLILNEDIDTGAIKANYHDGVLTVELPVAEAARPKKVAVGTKAATSTGASDAVEARSTEHQVA
jgi:HSP20 family protein